MKKGFSLIELLVAKFLNTRKQAALTVVNQNLSLLNNTYQQFIALGGQVDNDMVNWFGPGQTTVYILPFLADVGVSNPAYNPTALRQLIDYTDSLHGIRDYLVLDSFGVGGSWTISINTPIYSDPSDNDAQLASDPYDAWDSEYDFKDQGVSLPDGFVISRNSVHTYFKSAGLFYQIDFDPNAPQPFYLDSDSIPNGLPPSTQL
jgi:type II secretory pathway pseudopilin PulG